MQTVGEIPFSKVESFLADRALPFWSTKGAYPNGCFVELLDGNGVPLDPGFTRVRVQARQIYVFSHSLHYGLSDNQKICEASTNFFIKSAWLGESSGWASRISADGRVIDSKCDLYDISFALFALAWAYRVNPEKRLLEIAHQTLNYLDSQMRHPLGGFKNDAVGSMPRQQNPHMHLTEAMNAWGVSSGDARFVETGSNIVELFAGKFCDQTTGALGEFFNEDWSRAEGQAGEIVEPGHQFEWSWILGHQAQLSNRDRVDLMRLLANFGFAYGFDEASGLTVNQIDRRGQIINSGKRLWPQTEALKACLAQAEFLGTTNHIRICRIVNAIFDNFLNTSPVEGCWVDHYDVDWNPLVTTIPASSLYHITLAFLDLLRLRTKL